jgi:hypothetical protein
VFVHGQKSNAEGNGFALRSYAEDLSDIQVLLTDTGVSAENSNGVWPFPETEQLFYGRGPAATGATTTASLRRINYDGTNDTELVPFTESGNNRTVVQTPCIPRTGEFVFYQTSPLYIPGAGSDKFDEIRRCALDGTGDTAIFTCANRRAPLPAAGQINSVRVDNDHEKVMFTEIDSGAGEAYLKRMDFDGGNVETYVTISPFAGIRDCPFWSHKKQRVYFYRNSGTVGLRGWWSCEYDGSDLVQEITDAAWDAAIGDSAGTIGPGCGFEVTGAGYQV